MAITQSLIVQPGADPHRMPLGSSVHATIRRLMYGIKQTVTDPDDRTNPIPREATDRVTFFLEGTAGNVFDLELAYSPVWLPNHQLDVTNSSWVSVGSAVIGPSGVVKQTFEDIGHSFRLVRTIGTGQFSVCVWWLV